MLLGFVECFSGFQADIEDINDFARRRAATFCEGINVSRAYVESERRDQTAENRKFGEIIETDDDDVELAGSRWPGCYVHQNPMSGVESRRHSDVCRDFF